MTLMDNKKFGADWTRYLLVAVSMVVFLVSGAARAAVEGVQGTTFNLSAQEGYISVSDGGSIYSWGYTNTGTMQLPGPTLIVNQDDVVTIELTNNLPAAAGNVSIVFPGQTVAATGGVPGDLAQEAQNGGTVTYTFTATEPGTYQYHSGTDPDLQVEMGLYGALIVRPSSTTTTCNVQPSTDTATGVGGIAYNHADSCYEREYLYLLSEVDIHIHQAAEAQAGGPGPIVLPAGAYHSEYWLMNGRAGPDSMAADGTDILPYQPYGSLTRMHPGDRVLVRVVGAGREMHPFHTHGNHVRLLARDGRMLLTESTNQLAGPQLFTIPSLPGGTADAIFEWTGEELGWDMYEAGNGHNCVDNFDNVTGDATPDGYADTGLTGVDDVASDYPWEWCDDHDRPIPVTLPSLSSLAFGGFYSGSPYLGALGSLPPGEGGLNPFAGFAYMWHSHTERELVNNDVFPGGMMTMLIVEAPGTPID